MREYVVWRTLDRVIEWFVLRDEVYVPQAPGEDGLLRSEVFPGLVLDAEAMLKGDLTRVLSVQKEALIREEHAAFIARLEAANGGA